MHPVAWKQLQGKWPKLQDLSLFGSVFDTDSLQQIAKGRWPLLRALNISRVQDQRNYFHMEDFLLIELDPLQASQWALLESLQACGWNCIHLSGAQGCRWPKLVGLTASHINAMQAPKLRHLHLVAVTSPATLPNTLSGGLASIGEPLCSLVFSR